MGSAALAGAPARDGCQNSRSVLLRAGPHVGRSSAELRDPRRGRVMTNYQVTDSCGQVHRRTVSSLSSRTYTHAVVVHCGEYPAYGTQPPRAAFSRAEWHTTPALAERNAARWRSRLGAIIIGVEIVAAVGVSSATEHGIGEVLDSRRDLAIAPSVKSSRSGWGDRQASPANGPAQLDFSRRTPPRLSRDCTLRRRS